MIDFQVIKFGQVTSTMDVARECAAPLASQELPYVVMARHQTAGRGRRGKTWVSSEASLQSAGLDQMPAAFGATGEDFVQTTFAQSHAGEHELLPMTVVFPASVIQVPLSWFSIAAGCALFDAAHDLAVFLGSAFSEIFQLPVDHPQRFFLKWPNDIVGLNGKIAGLLVELATQKGQSGSVALGIGLNLFSTPGVAGSESLLDAILGAAISDAVPKNSQELREQTAKRRKMQKWLSAQANRELVFRRFLENLQRELQEYICVPRTVGQLRSLALARMFPLGTIFVVADAHAQASESQSSENGQPAVQAGGFMGLGDDGCLLLVGMPPLYAAEVSVKIAEQQESTSENSVRRELEEFKTSFRNAERPKERTRDSAGGALKQDETSAASHIGGPVKSGQTKKIENVALPEATLLLDAGNTRLHWALVCATEKAEKPDSTANVAAETPAPDEGLSVGHIPYDQTVAGRKLNTAQQSFKSLLAKLQEYRRSQLKIFWSSVLGIKETRSVVETLRVALEGVFPEIKVSSIGFDSKTVLEADTRLTSVLENYGPSLGVDRAFKILWAAAAAERIQGAVAVLSLGTATTFEVVASSLQCAKEKIQCGDTACYSTDEQTALPSLLLESLILPGIQMSFDVLSEKTAALPLLEYQKLSSEDLTFKVNKGTEASIARGVLHSIFYMAQHLCRKYMVKKLWICGGTSEHFVRCLKDLEWDRSFDVEVSENLGLRAMAVWLKASRSQIAPERADGFQPLLAHNLRTNVPLAASAHQTDFLNESDLLHGESEYGFLGEESNKVAASLFRGRKHYRNVTDLEPVDHDFRRLGGRIETVGAGERLDRHLGARFRFHSRAEWFERIKRGEIKIEMKASKMRFDDLPPALEKVKHTYRLKPFDQIWMFQPAEYEPGYISETNIIKDDGDTIVFHKPGNIVVHATGLYGRNTFLDVLEQQGYNNVFPVHRIDRETSGILMCARTTETRRNLAELFRLESMTKMYLAFVKSFVHLPKEFVIDAPIGPAPLINQSRIRLKMWVGQSSASSAARTRFVAVGKKDQYTLFLCFPETGRTNQIRAHLAAAGQWIVGDKMYHPDENVFLSYFDHGATRELLQCLETPRHALHNGVIYGDPCAAEIFKDGPVVCPLSQDLLEFRLFRDLLEESGIGLSETRQSAELLRLFLEHAPHIRVGGAVHAPSDEMAESSAAHSGVEVFGLEELQDLYDRAAGSFPSLGVDLTPRESLRGNL